MQTTVTPIRIEAASLAEMVGNCERVNCAARTSYLATALRFTQAHQFHGRVLPVCLLGHTLLLLLDGHKMNHAEQEHKGPMRLGRNRATICRKLLSNGVSFWWWVVTVSNGLSDGIRQVLSAGRMSPFVEFPFE